MTHHVLAVADAESKRLVINELASGTGRRVLFTRTKHQAKKLAKALTATGIPAVDLHGNLSQPARERNLEAFSSGSVKVLVATDIAARGIHVDHIELVVHVDPPAEHKAYLHRSGRTARAGEGGDVVTVMLPEQAGDVRTLTRQAKITVQPQQVRPGSAVVARLVGEVAAHVEPAPVAVVEAGRRGGAPSRDGAAGGPSRRRGGRGRSAGGQGGGQPGAGSGGQGGARGRGRAGSSAAPQRSATGGSRPVHSTATPGSGSSSRGGGVAMSMGSSAGRRRGR